jgi:hypothetical protein
MDSIFEKLLIYTTIIEYKSNIFSNSSSKKLGVGGHPLKCESETHLLNETNFLYLLQPGERGILQICYTNYVHYFILLISVISQQLIHVKSHY